MSEELTINEELMSKKQLDFIRRLFKEVSPHMTEEWRDEFVASMREYKDEMTKKEASDLINDFIKVRTEINLEIAKKRRAANLNKG